MANPTTNLNITLPEPAVESSRGTWGTTLNDAIQSLDTGIADRGVPSGGTDDQILTKNGTDDYVTEWATRFSSLTVVGYDGITISGGMPITTSGTVSIRVGDPPGLRSTINVEDGATADQTNAEIKTAYEANSDTNALTDALQTKLNTAATTAGSETLTNKTLTSPVLNTGVSGTAILDSDTMSGTSATTLSSSGSIKAYVDAQTHEPGDVTSVVAGSGLTGGGTTGDVTLNVVGGTGITANADDIELTDNGVTLAKMAGLDRGKVIIGDSSGNPSALALGTSGYVLKSDGSDIAWAADAGKTTEEIQDIAGGMFTGNTETGITATYEDGDGTIDLVVGTLNQDTTGTAAIATNVTVAAESTISSQTIVHQYNVNSEVILSCASHGLAENQPITVTVSGTPPEGVVTGTIYYVRPGIVTNYGSGLSGLANNFRLATSPGGSNLPVTTSGWIGSVSHVFHKVRYPLFTGLVTGDLSPKSGTGLTLTAEGRLTSTTFYGDLTGDVTGTASGIADGIVSEAKLEVSNAPTNGYVLTARSAATGDMTWEDLGTNFDTAGTGVAMAIALG